MSYLLNRYTFPDCNLIALLPMNLLQKVSPQYLQWFFLYLKISYKTSFDVPGQLWVLRYKNPGLRGLTGSFFFWIIIEDLLIHLFYYFSL